MQSDTLFKNKDFSGTDLAGEKFVNCVFKSCNFSLTKFDGVRLQEVNFEQCKLIGVNLGKCDPLFLKISFKDCLIESCNFSNLDLCKTLFHHCMIRETYFTETKLEKADFKGSDLRGSIFHNCDLSGASFLQAINYSMSPVTNKLKKCKFSSPEVLALLEHLEIVIEK